MDDVFLSDDNDDRNIAQRDAQRMEKDIFEVEK